ncbi:MAG: glycosyltransferase family 2 protein [Caldilineaceae bacterium]|nr:glycosyltransferase family 2 protein [Caldilineaceae bacterium]
MIIPARNEEQRLPESLEKIRRFLHTQPYQTEVLVVENGSTDDTSGLVQRFSEQLDPGEPFTVQLLHSAPGKGAAVKVGMLAGRGDYLFLCDADLSMPIEEISKFLPPHMDVHQYDVAIASREIEGAIRYDEPTYRHVMGRVFNFIVRTLIIPGVEDTQCGFKCFTREAAQQIFPYQTINGWGFDPEVLYIARLRGLNLIEVPINWYYMTESRVNPVRDTINMLRELLLIRRNGGRGLYAERAQPAGGEVVAD